MKKITYIPFKISVLLNISVLLSIVLVTSSYAQSLYDDFSVSYIKKSLWHDYWSNGVGDVKVNEFAREINSTDGVLVLKLGTHEQPSRVQNILPFKNSSSIYRIQADVQIAETNNDPTDDAVVFACIGGTFFNKEVSPTSKQGDIKAEICVGDRGSGIEAWYRVEEFTSDSQDDNVVMANQSIVTNLDEDRLYTMEIEYDESESTFLFTISGDGLSSTQQMFDTNYDVGTSAYDSFKGLYVSVHENLDDYGDGFIQALFDNVYINEDLTPYDQFSGSILDPLRWDAFEYVRDATGGKARLCTRSDVDFPKNRFLLRDCYTPYLETTVRVSSRSLMTESGTGWARIAGYFYNEGAGPGGNAWIELGFDLWADIAGIKYLTPFAQIEIYDAEGEFERFELAIRFGFNVYFDRDYRLSIKIEENGVLFSYQDMITLQGETYFHPFSGPVYPAENPYLLFESRAGGGGYLIAQFDDVLVADPDLTNLSGTWKSQLSNCQITGGMCTPEPDEFSLQTLTQNGTEIYLVDDEGLEYFGVISGSRLLAYSSEIRSGELVDIALDATLNNRHSGSGTLNISMTDGCEEICDLALKRQWLPEAVFLLLFSD